MRMIFFLILACSGSVQADTFNLDFSALPSLVAERNNHAKGAELIAKAAEKQTGHLLRSYLPEVNAKVGGETFTTGDVPQRTEMFGGVEAKINIFRSGRDKLEEEIRAKQSAAAKILAAGSYREELRKARVAYWNLVSQRELIKVLEGAIKDNEKNLTAANTRIRAGIATETDQIEFGMARVELEQDLARLKLSNNNLQRELAALLGFPATTSFTVPDLVTHEHEDSLLNAQLDLTTHPEVAPLASRIQILSLKSAQVRRSWLPSVDIFGMRELYTFREREYESQANRWDSVVGLQLSMNLFDGGIARSEASALALEASGHESEVRQTSSELLSRFEAAKSELRLTHDLVHNSESTLQKSERYISRTLDEYRRGVKNSMDVLNASGRLFEIKRRFAELRRDYQLARAELLAMVGK